ncbi:hypothetical protein AAY473_023694 [Plecturocebus cupreus]
MAKRRAAEPVTFHVPWKRLLLCDFPEHPPPPPLWIRPPGAAHPGQPLGVPEQHRKRKIDAGTMAEPSASPSKRHDSGDNSAPGGQEQEDRGLETGEPPLLLPPPPLRRGPGEELQGARPPRDRGDDGAGRAGPPQGDWGVAPRQVGAGSRWAEGLRGSPFLPHTQSAPGPTHDGYWLRRLQRRKQKVTTPGGDADPQETRPGIPRGQKALGCSSGKRTVVGSSRSGLEASAPRSVRGKRDRG